MDNQNIRIRLRGFDNSLLDASTLDIIKEIVSKYDLKIEIGGGVRKIEIIYSSV